MALAYGNPPRCLVVGISDRVSRLPVVNIPEGARVRVRLRPDDFAYAYVKTADGLRKYPLYRVPEGFAIAFDLALAANVTATPQ